MSGELWGFLGSVVAGMVAVAVAVVRTRGAQEAEGRSVTVSEVNSLGERLDKQATRMDEMQERLDRAERENRSWRRHYERDLALHIENGWPIIDLPEELL